MLRAEPGGVQSVESLAGGGESGEDCLSAPEGAARSVARGHVAEDCQSQRGLETTKSAGRSWTCRTSASRICGRSGPAASDGDSPVSVSSRRARQNETTTDDSDDAVNSLDYCTHRYCTGQNQPGPDSGSSGLGGSVWFGYECQPISHDSGFPARICRP